MNCIQTKNDNSFDSKIIITAVIIKCCDIRAYDFSYVVEVTHECLISGKVW